MRNTIMSQAHKYERDHINTDEIIPARYLNTDDKKELAKHCMEDLDGNFVNKVRPKETAAYLAKHMRLDAEKMSELRQPLAY